MKKPPRFSKLRVESLEERTLLAVTAGAEGCAVSLPEPTEAATWWVETVEDTTGSESFSLRDAIAKAQDGDTVRFVPELSGQTITLSAGQLRVRRGVTVDATDLPGGITIDAGGNSRVFFLSGGTESAPVLKGLTITGGKDTNNGAGVYCSAGTVALSGCIVAGNTVGSIGGGIYNGGTMTLTNCTVSGNTATEYHGAIFNKGTLTMADTVIEGNFGCGIYNIEGTLTITDSLIAGNTADTGGGIYTYNGTITITGSTIAGNTADTGGGIYVVPQLPVVLNVCNSVITQNQADGNGDDIFRSGTSGTLSARNTLSSYTDWTDSENCLEYDSNLPLFTDAENGDYTLAAGSQAINAGNNDFVTAKTDLAGNPRIVNGIVDLGAYEYQGCSPAEQLASPTILTGNHGVYVSAGANRHQIFWNGFENVSGYELQYSADGGTWTTVSVLETSAIVTGLTYGQNVKYRVRALGDGVSYTDSDWSADKVFKVCPMDINNDGDISGGDRTLLVNSWLSEEGEDEYLSAADINGDGNVSGGDRVFLSNNWLMDPEEEGFQYPAPLAAEAIFAEFASADPGEDLNVF
ncbi:MAG: hypothetical protein IJG60_07060 [Thermoguttaceae bacterium]|nr:hypothetical protein [Thermoguttaceae bacterium]